MDQTPDVTPKTLIPRLRTWSVMAGMLVLPWLLRSAPSASPQHGDMTFFIILACWSFLTSVWSGCLLALAVRRAELLGLMTCFTLMFWLNLVLLMSSYESHDRVRIWSVFGAFLLSQLISFIVTFFLRLDSTLAHVIELPPANAEKQPQFSLRALLIVTVVMSVIAAIISAAAREGRLQELATPIPWLLLINMAVIWNELLRPRLRLWALVGCSFVWGGLWGLASVAQSAEISFFAASLSALVYAIPLAWRWAGWRIVPQLWFLPPGTKL